jgi:hypothetical protein
MEVYVNKYFYEIPNVIWGKEVIGASWVMFWIVQMEVRLAKSLPCDESQIENN